jgi:hypothetical protein
VRIYIKVIPRSSLNKVEKVSEGEYKAWVTAAPIDNKANKMLIRILADHFGVSKSSLKIISGRTAKKKLVEII